MTDKSDDRLVHLNAILGPRGRKFERSNLQEFKCPGFAPRGGMFEDRFDRRITISVESSSLSSPLVRRIIKSKFKGISTLHWASTSPEFQGTSRLLSTMPNRPVRDKWDYPRKMERHFPIKPRQQIGIALATFYHLRIP